MADGRRLGPPAARGRAAVRTVFVRPAGLRPAPAPRSYWGCQSVVVSPQRSVPTRCRSSSAEAGRVGAARISVSSVLSSRIARRVGYPAHVAQVVAVRLGEAVDRGRRQPEPHRGVGRCQVDLPRADADGVPVGEHRPAGCRRAADCPGTGRRATGRSPAGVQAQVLGARLGDAVAEPGVLGPGERVGRGRVGQRPPDRGRGVNPAGVRAGRRAGRAGGGPPRPDG